MEAREERGRMRTLQKSEGPTSAEAPVRPQPAGSLLTAGEVGEMLGVPRSWVYEQSRKGRIPTVTLGRYRRYRAEAIERWVAELEAEGVGF
jgi:excisionase family DNA binding protein